MGAFFEGRPSDSPFIETIWRGHSDPDYERTCPADSRWNLLLLKEEGRVRVTVEGPTTQAVYKFTAPSTEFLVIKFKLGVFLPAFLLTELVNTDRVLPEGASDKTFWLNGAAWQLPDFENAEYFVNRLVREETLVIDPIVGAVLQNHPQEISLRTVRRHFLQTTGLTPKGLQQIERAQQAATLLQKGQSILDTVATAGYADQPHLTRALKRFYGRTPAELGRIVFAE